MDKEYKKPQIYNYAEIKASEAKIFEQYIGLLKQYDEVMNNLRMFESVKDYIIFNKLKSGAKMVLVNGQILSVTKKFNEIYLKLESE